MVVFVNFFLHDEVIIDVHLFDLALGPDSLIIVGAKSGARRHEPPDPVCAK